MSLAMMFVARRHRIRRTLTLAYAASGCALLDGLTTQMSLANGGIEINPLIGTQPDAMLLAALTFCKMLAAFAALNAPPMFRIPFLTGAVAVWGGVSVNNILVATIVPDPVPLVGGVLAGLCLLAWAVRLTLPVSRS